MLLNYLPPSNKRTTSCLCLNGGLVSNVSNCIKLYCGRCSLKNISTTKRKRVLCTLFGQVVGFQKTLLKVHSKGLLEAGIVISQPWSLQCIQCKIKLQGESIPRIRGAQAKPTFWKCPHPWWALPIVTQKEENLITNLNICRLGALGGRGFLSLLRMSGRDLTPICRYNFSCIQGMGLRESIVFSKRGQ